MTEPWGSPSEPRHQRGRPDGQRRPEPHYERDGRRAGAPPSYLERDPYRELSELGLEQEARAERYGRSEYAERPGSAPPPGREPRDGGSSRARPRSAAKQSNGLAVAGAVLSFIPLLGLILSIIGGARSNRRGGAGRMAASVGIVLSLAFSAALGFGVYEVSRSTAADPACISAESDAVRLAQTVDTDGAALNTAEQSGDKSRFVPAANKFVGDMQSLKTTFDGAQAEATHADVRAAIQSFDADLGTFITGMHQVLAGNTSGENATSQAVNRLQSDGDALDRLCGSVTDG